MGRYAPRKLADGTICTAGPTCRLHGNVASASPLNDFNKRVEALNKPDKVSPLKDFTPVQVDEQLSEIYGRLNKAEDEQDYLFNRLESREKSLAEAQEAFDKNPDGFRVQTILEQHQSSYDSLQESIKEKDAAILALRQEMIPGEAEFIRRGGWSRAFLVNNTNGHVHKTMGCSTCNKRNTRTRFTWLPAYSGKKETDIVSDAGSSACTECYPTAPVDVLSRPSRIQDPKKSAPEIIKAENDRAAKKAAAEAKKIANPDGRPLKLESYYGSVSTIVSATSAATEIRSDFMAIEAGRYDINSTAIEQRHRDYAVLVTALAHKNGITEDAQREILEVKSKAKYNKNWK